MCTVLLSPGVNPIAVNKCIHIYLYKPEHVATRDHLQWKQHASCVDCVKFNVGSSNFQTAAKILRNVWSAFCSLSRKKANVRKCAVCKTCPSFHLQLSYETSLTPSFGQLHSCWRHSRLQFLTHSACCCSHSCSICKCRIASLRFTVVWKYLLRISRGVTHSPHPNTDSGLCCPLWIYSVVCSLLKSC